jgi:hypothetical protein
MAKKDTAAARAAMPDPLAKPPAQQELQPTTPSDKIKVYEPIEAGLALMLQKHGHVLTAPPVVTAENRETVHASAMEMVKFRTTLEQARKDEKEASLRYGQCVDSEARRIQAVAAPIEQAYKNAIATFDNAEAERKQAILKRLAEVRGTGQQAIGKSIEQLEQILEGLSTLDLPSFQEFREQAGQAQLEATRQVGTLLQQAREAKAAREQLEREQEQERQRRAAIEAEEKRVGAIRARIAVFRDLLGTAAMARSSTMLAKLIEQAKAVVVDDSYAELVNEAKGARALVIEELTALFDKKVKAEAEAAEAQRAREVAAAAPRPEPVAQPPTPAAAPPKTYPSGAPMFSTSTFKENGAPIMLDEHGKRSVFCDVDEGDGPQRAAPAASVYTPQGLMPERPTDDQIVDAIATEFDEHGITVIEWLEAMDFRAQRERLGQPALPFAA